MALATQTDSDHRFLWFHSTRRTSIREYFDLLRAGSNPPQHDTATLQCELKLGIAQRCVYCYLGLALEAFGDFAVALDPNSLPPATISPFDSGGLLRHIRPVSEWKDRKQKKRYLSFYSWSTATLAERLTRYPGPDSERRLAYLKGERPSEGGPHVFWTSGPVADIWQDPHNSLHAWLWEGRWPTTLPIPSALVAWSCSPAQYAKILDHIDNLQEPDAHQAALDLLKKYVAGGVSALVDALRMQQVAS